jgi:hypothetical protein
LNFPVTLENNELIEFLACFMHERC